MRKRGLILATAVMLFPAEPTAVQAQDGFMFGQPKAQLTLRAGPVLYKAGGDLFDFFQSELTLDRSDFRAPAIGGDIAIVVHPRLDVALGAAWSQSESRSASFDSSCIGTEYECTYVDTETDLPIEQTTTFRVIPVIASVRFYPLSRGRRISELAWVPARLTPYVGGGGGVGWYRLLQSGEFVAKEIMDGEEVALIFPADLESSGRAAVGQLFAGVDHWFTPRAGLNVEARYTFGSATPGYDFVGWDSIDLSGLQLGVGLAVRW